MRLRLLRSFAALALLGAAPPLLAQPAAPPVATPEPVDTAVVRRIRALGLDGSNVMETLALMTDVYGPRLTGSAGLDRATAWVQTYLGAMGLQNVHTEAWGPFGRGWTLDRFALMASGTGVQPFPLVAFPKAWSPSVQGEGDVVVFDAQTPDDFARFRGTLRGKVVLLEPLRAVTDAASAANERLTDAQLLAMANYAGDLPVTTASRAILGSLNLNGQRMQFLAEEGPLVVLDRSAKGDYGTVFVSGASVPVAPGTSFEVRPTAWNPRGQTVMPQATVSAEPYNRLVRLAARGIPLRVSIDLAAHYDEADPMEANVIAELAGADRAAEVVMLGAHFDSWHAGTGATDNGAGSAVMVEAMRILQRVFADTGTRPRRTVRLALWTGEEQGLYGSRAYVAQHFGTRGPDGLSAKPEHATLAGYFNLDNGTGKIRGVYLQGNEAAVPVFRAWLRPFADLGASTLTLQNTGGTDHLAFDGVGLPGFQFIQEPMAYGTRTHHSNMDVLDHASEADLKQAATLVAAFAYHAAMRGAMLPRKPVPAATAATPATAPRPARGGRD